MLRKLHIQNYAIIREIEIDFSNKLNVITGETGAGKSILVGALSLILGERADNAMLQSGDKKCVVEGFFAVKHKKDVAQFLTTNELDVEDELVLRREISVTGKSRGFINDTPATLQQLRELATLLVDLHQQFDTLEIGDNNFQRNVLDGLAGNFELVTSFQIIFRKWQKLNTALQQLQQQKDSAQKELDYNQYLFNELEQLSLKENELEELEAELKRLTHAEDIKAVLSKAYFELKDRETPVVQQLKLLSNQLQSFSAYHQQMPELIQRLQSAHLELLDVAAELESMDEEIIFDQQRIDAVNEKISAGYKLLKKHNVQTTAELIAIRDELANKLEAVLNMDETIATTKEAAEKLLQQSQEKANIISKRRKNEVAGLEQKVNALLKQVGMPNARLKVQVLSSALYATGNDDIEFLFDANKSNRFEPVRKVASGGELSRLMLCIKSLVAQSVDLPTLIFDEIDTGISGEAAKQVSIIMKELSINRQIISITHQPQIAGKADAHFFVFKEIDGEFIKTNIRRLSQNERITTIAQMLSGEKPTAAALANAQEMLN